MPRAFLGLFLLVKIYDLPKPEAGWFVLYKQEVRVMFNSLARRCSVEEIVFKRHGTDMDCLVYSGAGPAVSAS